MRIKQRRITTVLHVTKSEIEPEINSMFPWKKVSPIQAIPKIATTAVAPALNTLPETISSTFGLQKIIISAEIVSITISIDAGIVIRVMHAINRPTWT